ncbi:hypothetical protein KKB44_02085 [Candidatus Micrarchaeota archaeon]|nr:hypothetical protein [Candidatus Micrarchaeota archaeon]
MKAVLIFLLLTTILHAEFLVSNVEITIGDIQSDGGARVHESVQFLMFGDYSSSLYDSGISQNSLSYWSSITGLKDVKMHVNTANVHIQDFRLRPQPRTSCNPIQGTCHGELILDYWAYPTINDSTPVPGTGLFNLDKYKPRTTRYTLNPTSLSFTTTEEGSVVLDENTNLIIQLPVDSILLDVNPYTEEDLDLPEHISELSWNDIVLVKFSLVFDVEEGIDKEISDFFTNISLNISETLSTAEGFALIILIAILIGSYLYIVMAKRRGED